MQNTITTKDTIDHLRQVLISDEDYRNTWKANIAMAYYDAVNSFNAENGRQPTGHEVTIVGNKAAEAFLELLCQ